MSSNINIVSMNHSDQLRREMADNTPHPREVKLQTIRGMMSDADYEKFSADYYSTFSAAKRNEMLDAKIAELTSGRCVYCGETLGSNDAATEHAGICAVMNAEPPAAIPDSFETPATDADEADRQDMIGWMRNGQ